jgi:hypothetical protein
MISMFPSIVKVVNQQEKIITSQKSRECITCSGSATAPPINTFMDSGCDKATQVVN